MNNNALICLDWDGTLVDSFGRISGAVQCAADDVGLKSHAADEIQKLIGWSHEQIWSTLYPEEKSNLKLAEEFWQRFTVHYNKKKSSLFPSTRLALQQMSKYANLVIVTNKPRVFLNQELIDFNLSNYFNATYSSTEFQNKPDPEMINQAISECDSAYVCMIGDAPADQMAAQNAAVPFYKIEYNEFKTDTNIKTIFNQVIEVLKSTIYS